MMCNRLPKNQQGAVLFVGMIMLVLIMLMVAASFTLSNSNMKSVGNMQFKNEAIASANKAIEQTISSWDWTTAFPMNDITVDIDNDDRTDYVVTVSAPTCISSAAVPAPDIGGNELNLGADGTFMLAAGPGAGPAPPSNYNIVVNIAANVASKSTGAQVMLNQGMSKTVTKTQCNAICVPPATSGLCT